MSSNGLLASGSSLSNIKLEVPSHLNSNTGGGYYTCSSYSPPGSNDQGLLTTASYSEYFSFLIVDPFEREATSRYKSNEIQPG